MEQILTVSELIRLQFCEGEFDEQSILSAYPLTNIK